MINLYKELKHINHSRERRAYFADLIIQYPEIITDVLKTIRQIDDEISCKASWALEFVCKKHLNYILPHMDDFIDAASKVYQHSAVRPMAKICEYLILAYHHKNPSEVKQKLTTMHRKKIAEISFDWLITDQKVAAKAYSMTSLYLLGKEFDWIHPELKIVLENSYESGSVAYKARARMILNKLKKQKV